MKLIVLLLLLGAIFCSCKVRTREIIGKEQCLVDSVLQNRDSAYIQITDMDTCEIYRLCLNNESDTLVIYRLVTEDGSSIDYLNCYKENGNRIFDCFAIYNNAADGNRFLFFNYANKISYITDACFSGFYPIISSVDLINKELLLENNYSPDIAFKDTLDIGDSRDYIGYSDKIRFIKVKLHQL